MLVISALTVRDHLTMSETRLILLDNDARKEAARTFKSIGKCSGVITMGISTIQISRKCDS